MHGAVLADLGARIGLLGDAHGDLRFLQAGIHALAARGVTSIVQLGDFGLIWDGGDRDRHALAVLNTALRLVDQTLFVLAGNHDGHPAIAALPTDADGVRRIGRVGILPRSGRGTAAGRPIGWLSGAASVDRSRRTAGVSWWPEELLSPAEAVGLTAGRPVDIVFAHDALDSCALTIRLARTAGFWDPDDLRYAEAARAEFSNRVLGVLSDDGLVVSGHYHFRMSIDEEVTRPDGTAAQARNEILSCQFAGPSVAVLDVATLTIDAFALDSLQIGRDWQAFRSLLKRIPDGARRVQEALAPSRRELEQMRNGILLPPPALLAEFRSWLPDDVSRADP